MVVVTEELDGPISEGTQLEVAVCKSLNCKEKERNW